ncbi:hypothetical protein [Tenacibaculum sp. 190524A05c]|uniref:hypothetical protein n=1 Tax=Tenacibaculum platacis TaxID=3137852 RepID=UPI0032B304BA
MIGKKIIFILCILFCNVLLSQVFPGTPVSGYPSGTTAQINAIANPVEATIAYSTNEQIFYYYNGSNWVPFNTSSNTIGDVKYGAQTGDHSGWYILNGRSITSLPANAQTAANSLGFTGTLPNATNRVLKHPNTGQNIGDTGGQVNTTLTQANLPNVNFTGNTNNAGNHRHTIPRRTRTFRVFNNVDSNVTFFANNGTTNTSTAGNHNHTVSVNSGGSNQSFERYQPYLVVNTFIYLGL